MRLVHFAAAGVALPILLAQAPDLSTKSLAAAAMAYVADYEARFTFLVADEEYTQQVLDPAGRQTARRQMQGELFLTFIPADHTWIAVHDIATVDDQPVPDRDGLRVLLQKGEVTRVAKQIADRNAAFNIGGIQRNFNEPTLPLLLLGPKRIKGVSFDRRQVVRHPDGTRVTLAFAERDRPTLIRSVRGSAIHAKGELIVDAATGRIERTTLELEDGEIVARLSTDYAREDRLDMWVPSVFTERYEGAARGRREVIVCEARYTNYRRFEVTGRIK